MRLELICVLSYPNRMATGIDVGLSVASSGSVHARQRSSQGPCLCDQIRASVSFDFVNFAGFTFCL